jgi:hypothetical protein
MKPMPVPDPISGYKSFAQQSASSSQVIVQELIQLVRSLLHQQEKPQADSQQILKRKSTQRNAKVEEE